MRIHSIIMVLLTTAFAWALVHADEHTDIDRDILVTFDNTGARAGSSGLAAPYSNRRRYSISRGARQKAAAVMAEHRLVEIEHWPIRSLSVYCFVYRIPDGADRKDVIARLKADRRVESVQAMQKFDTSVGEAQRYDDTHANLQYGLELLDIHAAHMASTGSGIRIAIVDSHADRDHEDLLGQIDSVKVFSPRGSPADSRHGTAVASVIGARPNNARGIVGIAPEASLELYVACWSEGKDRPAVCDSFTLLKALDSVFADPPHILNLSLKGPHDSLLERVLVELLDVGVIVVAAGPAATDSRRSFPASMDRVIGVASSATDASSAELPGDSVFAPGDRILVAVPTDNYDFRSGTSLAAAHVSGVVALMLASAPGQSRDAVQDVLRRSQVARTNAQVSVNACTALLLVGLTEPCGDLPISRFRTEF